jgi:hypothetical protein
MFDLTSPVPTHQEAQSPCHGGGPGYVVSAKPTRFGRRPIRNIMFLTGGTSETQVVFLRVNRRFTWLPIT